MDMVLYLFEPNQSDVKLSKLVRHIRCWCPDHSWVVLVLRVHSLPPLFKRARVRDDFFVVATVVVRLDHRIRATAGNVVGLLREVA